VAGKADKSGKRVRNKSSRAVVKKDRNLGPDILAEHMAAVAKQMNDMLGEIRSVRQLLDDEIRRSSQDHDEQIGIKKDLETVQSKMVDIERRVQEKLNVLEEVLKDAKKKKWEIIVAILSAFITAIAGMIILRVFPTSTAQAPTPTLIPDPKPHSAIYSPVEPRPFLFLRGTGRES
jgi:cell division protein ZapA (FtsZ GTPase activity inhibitor)